MLLQKHNTCCMNSDQNIVLCLALLAKIALYGRFMLVTKVTVLAP